jgi:hypothetical protein
MSETLPIGVTPRELTPGTVVMVAAGQVSAAVNGGPCLIVWAVVRGPVDPDQPADVKPDDVFWLDVYAAPDLPQPLPQMYRAKEILGVPAPGLSMLGAPEAYPGMLPDR